MPIRAAQKIYEEYSIPRETMAARVRHVMQSAFDGRRIVLFSGGPKENDDQVLLDQVRAVRDGGGSGSIVGRNVFQREKTHALNLLDDMLKVYKGEIT